MIFDSHFKQVLQKLDGLYLKILWNLENNKLKKLDRIIYNIFLQEGKRTL